MGTHPPAANAAPRHVLVPHDFGPAAERALAWAAQLAAESGAAVTVLHVVLAPRATGLGFDLARPSGALTAGEHHALEGRLAAAARRCGVDGARCEVACAPEIGAAVVAAAAEHGCDLIAMGTHGGGAVSRALVGSVADYVVRHAPCPVATLRARR